MLWFDAVKEDAALNKFNCFHFNQFLNTQNKQNKKQKQKNRNTVLTTGLKMDVVGKSH